MDARIGPKFLRAGIGYGGSCFPKDVAAFRYVAEQFGVNFDLLKEVESINEEQKKRFFKKVRSALWTFRGKRIGVLGLAFKGGTDDIRDSPALDIVEQLLKEGTSVSAYDPAAAERSKEVIPPSENMIYVDDPYAAAQDADALLILSDWQEFGELDLDRLHYHVALSDCDRWAKSLRSCSHDGTRLYLSLRRASCVPAGARCRCRASSSVNAKTFSGAETCLNRQLKRVQD